MSTTTSQITGVTIDRLFRHRSKETSKLCVTGLCVGNSPVTGEYPVQMASNAENVSIWWRHHELERKSARPYGPQCDTRGIIITSLGLLRKVDFKSTLIEKVFLARFWIGWKLPASPANRKPGLKILVTQHGSLHGYQRSVTCKIVKHYRWNRIIGMYFCIPKDTVRPFQPTQIEHQHRLSEYSRYKSNRI